MLCTHSVGDYPAIIVEDVRLALGDIAREERKRIGMKVVGVTGLRGQEHHEGDDRGGAGKDLPHCENSGEPQ